MTYNEKVGNKPFNWYEALTSPNPDWYYLFVKAGNWVTCACGNQCAVIPRDFIGEPVDKQLKELGLSFFLAVNDENVGRALSILKNIEQRSTYLINQINNK